MSRRIKYYQEEDMQPWKALDWDTVKSFLWSGYDIRWAGGQKQAEECIDNGVHGGDVLAIFESFSHFIWILMRDKKITVADSSPLPSPPDKFQVHNNLYFCLQDYAEHFNDTYSKRMESWDQVRKCLEENGFDKMDNRNTICKAVYTALSEFISRAGNTSNALVIAKAHSDMRYTADDGGFGKRGRSNIPASEFSPQMWLVNFDPSDTEATRTEKTQRGVSAIFKLAAAGASSYNPPQRPQFNTPYYLSKGTTVELTKAVNPGSMVSFQSSLWDWRTSRTGENTSLDLFNDAGDYLLRISLRQEEHQIVLNSRHANGPWGSEERIHLRDTYIASNFSISVRNHGDGYELQFSHQPAAYYKKRIPGGISSVSYIAEGSYSPLSEILIVSVFDATEQLAQTSHRADCEAIVREYGKSNTPPVITQPTFRRGANFVAVPGQEKKDNLGFEYAEHGYLGDAIILTLSNGKAVRGRDYKFTLENGLNVTYGEINGLAGDFYGTHDPISDGANETERVTRFVAAYNTLAGRYARQPQEAEAILKVLQTEVDAVNAALARHEDPSIAYSKLPGQTWKFQKLTMFRPLKIPSYLVLAKKNFDHFGEDARIAYNAGHSKALDVAISGDLDKAYAMNAFADHFLEDSFSAGHLRTPRRYLHSDNVLDPDPDYCAKLMHDEDNAIGLLVSNPSGETWTAYGDKRALDKENQENKDRCIAAIQISAIEIYKAWATKVKPKDYGAWNHAPTLMSARGKQQLAPLFIGEQRRTVIKDRRTWNFTSDWYFDTTVALCLASGWWNYPITINGPSKALSGSDITAVATGSSECNVYHQDSQGVIREYTYNGKWNATKSPTFSAKLSSPLAVISFDAGKQVRVYCVSEDGYLEEWCHSPGQDEWLSGYLTNSKFRVAHNTRLAAVHWHDDGSNIIRVYAQEPHSDHIQEYCSGNIWTKGAKLPVAHTGSGLAAVCWKNNGIHLRVYYQATDMTVKEQCWDGSWYEGELSTDKMPRHTSITAVGWYKSNPHIRVYCQDGKNNIVTYKSDNGWRSNSKVIGPLGPGRHTSALEWGNGSDVKLYHQADDDKIYEHVQSNGKDWHQGDFVSS
ncbi:fungal fucose-specific lectin-domain-containing protein [Daldinia vernicosa]|uniref:fungal fucose-specific lectin-domain-containing protein n=1 Tax=Daldinia vernicosa TaxID=114800 RepID=UPI0020076A2C|nr:fungal fucose-specific lectin-domain-containing protein [Daldinia vernicosa]KAI0846452.1 fungal fucose-specific lectin-domain-containing protein [Daldinia vernicosa]